MTTLPKPNTKEYALSKQLTADILEEMKSTGYLSFARFMELALYAPTLGYYTNEFAKFGREGDFVTAPHISLLFSKCIARQCKQILKAIGSSDILELGAGSGLLAKDLLIELEKQDSLPRHYFILEISPILRRQQRDLLTAECPHLLPRIQWLDTLPKHPFKGIIFANEVLDALPVHCFEYTNDTIKERSVTFEKNQFSWCLTPFSPNIQSTIEKKLAGFHFKNHYQSEINLMLPDFIEALAKTLDQGTLLLLDYGYGRHEYYHPDRSEGTLMCCYQHHRHTNPLLLAGLQDITAHVDFTLVAEYGTSAGLTLKGLTTQTGFLLALGLLSLAEEEPLTDIQKYQQNQAIKTLTLPSRMGEIVKAIAFNKNLDIPLLGFSLYDRRKDL
ncbi:MAG: hypothetical protein ACD_60C00025G0006 [uncultured bacterium]|nr:MAG: hypothetical protein ACD_60C00025G0006 [uncultured bacterium]